MLLKKLSELYDHLVAGGANLPPIGCVLENCHIEITIDNNGCFSHATILSEEDLKTVSPMQSNRRTNGKKAYPLYDTIEYCAGYDNRIISKDAVEKYNNYISGLRKWINHSNNNTLKLIIKYINSRTLVDDLLRLGIIEINNNNINIQSKKLSSESPLKKTLLKTENNFQIKAKIRWVVQDVNKQEHRTWKDLDLLESWANYFKTLLQDGLCIETGQTTKLCDFFPKVLGGKLLSANDDENFTYLGNLFNSHNNVCSISYEIAEKSHIALNYMLDTAHKSDKQHFISWNTNSYAVNNLFEKIIEPSDGGVKDSINLQKVIYGYCNSLSIKDNVYFLGLDKATPGRVSIIYLNILNGVDFKENIESWYKYFTYNNEVVSVKNIINCVLGFNKSKTKEKSKIRKEVLISILENKKLPYVYLQSGFNKTLTSINSSSINKNKKNLITFNCLYFNIKGNNMNSTQQRSYLFGKLFANYHSIESLYLYIKKEERQTYVERNFRKITQAPTTIQYQIHSNSLIYQQKLIGLNRAGAAKIREINISKLTEEINNIGGWNNNQLIEEFLLGFLEETNKLYSTSSTDEIVENKENV